MGLFRALKTNARRALAGSWGRAIGIMLISVIPGVLINLLEYGIREVSGVSEFVNRSGTGQRLPGGGEHRPRLHRDHAARVAARLFHHDPAGAGDHPLVLPPHGRASGTA